MAVGGFSQKTAVLFPLVGRKGRSERVSASYGCDPPGSPGNAAIILRSRLKVKVVKELRGKKTALPNGVTENGLLASDWDTEAGKQVMEYQVCGHVPPLVLRRLPASGRGKGGNHPSGLLDSPAAAQVPVGQTPPPRLCSAPQCAVPPAPGLKRGGD